jgi:sugar phosphate isomerase/epimerase
LSATPLPRSSASVSPNPSRSARLDPATRLSINQTTTVRWSLDDAVAAFHTEGVRSIGVSLNRLRESGVENSARLLRHAGLTASSLGWVGGFTGTHGHSFNDAVADARSALVAAHQIGARTLIVVPGALNGHIRSHARRLLVEALVALADDATALDVRLALQPMHPIFEDEWSFLTSLDDTLDIIRRFNHTHVGLAFGTYHLWQEPRLLERIPEILPYVALAQLSDWREPPRCDNDRLLPGDGTLPLAEIIAAFESAGYRNYYEIEVWSRDLWKRDHRSLIRECTLRFAQLLTTPT